MILSRIIFFVTISFKAFCRHKTLSRPLCPEGRAEVPSKNMSSQKWGEGIEGCVIPLSRGV